MGKHREKRFLPRSKEGEEISEDDRGMAGFYPPDHVGRAAGASGGAGQPAAGGDRPGGAAGGVVGDAGVGLVVEPPDRPLGLEDELRDSCEDPRIRRASEV